jgi:hypothetical protein
MRAKTKGFLIIYELATVPKHKTSLKVNLRILREILRSLERDLKK